MNSILDYFDAIKERLLNDPLIADFHILRERIMETEGHLRARLTLEDGSMLEFSEYVRHTAIEHLHTVIYSYHWADAEGQLCKRWDNTPHYPDLSNFPHHIHDGKTGAVMPGKPINIFHVLDIITTDFA
ncbi:MAG TPA: DUF6516 family protein [Anaerolineae bacterium]|nr:DUF6516 family protein [Anaerolineae bacterium]HQI84814.1 DUF6516 family protein [Anaerolineae bacterium]